MSLHSDLPIYKVAYELFLGVTGMTKNMPRDFKQSVGGEIRQEALSIVMLIFRANAARDKTPHLQALLEHLVVLELLLRLSHDMRFISSAQYATVVALTISVGKQAKGWIKSASSPVSSPSRR